MASIFSIYADEAVDIKFKRNIPNPVGGGIGRAPMHLPIEVVFDDATGVLSITAPEDMEGQVYIYNISGALEASSDHLNCQLTLPTTSGMHILSLQGESWIGEAKIVF